MAVGDIKDIIEKMAEAGASDYYRSYAPDLRLCHRGYVLHNGSVIQWRS